MGRTESNSLSSHPTGKPFRQSLPHPSGPWHSCCPREGQPGWQRAGSRGNPSRGHCGAQHPVSEAVQAFNSATSYARPLLSTGYPRPQTQSRSAPRRHLHSGRARSALPPAPSVPEECGVTSHLERPVLAVPRSRAGRAQARGPLAQPPLADMAPAAAPRPART